MKKLFTFLFYFLFLSSFVYAQNRTINGKVTNTAGEVLAGVSVAAASGAGAATDLRGNYTINVPSSTTTLSFTLIGHKQVIQSIGSSSTLNVVMELESTQLSEVVINGAYGITTSARSAAHNIQVVDQEKLNTVRQTDVNNALAGKVAGVQVRSQSAAALGRETVIRLRGVNGFGSGTSAIYVVDGTILPNINDLNLDDIESLSVLQGPAAAALLGSQGANGAVVITLKKASKSPGIGVTLNLGATVDKVGILPAYQDVYAGGASSSLMKYTWQEGHPVEWKVLDGKMYHDMQDDSSWGPKMEGQEVIPWYAWYGGHSRAYQTTALTPQPNNIRDFYETGLTFNNGITLNHASDRLGFKSTFNNQEVNGLLPGTSQSKNNINISATYKINDRWEMFSDINYINRKLFGEIDDAYGSQSAGLFGSWFHRDVNVDMLKELRGLNHNGIYASFNKRNPGSYNAVGENWYQANYHFNPYTYFDLRTRINQHDRLYGNIGLAYKVMKGLTIRGTYRKQQNTTFTESKIASELQNSGYQTEVFAYYGTETTYSNRDNFEFIATFNRKFKDISVNANAGADFFSAVSKSNGGNTRQGLVVPNGYFLANSVQTPAYSNSRSANKYNAIFGTATVGYKDFLFVNGTLRNDWFSTLPKDHSDVMSKSFGATFIFSDFLRDKIDWLTFGKLRYSWGEIPQSLAVYQYPGMDYTISTNQWNGNILMPTPDRLVDPNIKGAVSRDQEIGIDLRFLKDRASLSVTLWDGTNTDMPYALTINGASGYTSLLTNIGKITKKGIEISLSGKPVVTNNFSWEIGFNYADLIKNDIVELSREYEVTRSGAVANVSFAALPQVYHQEGMRWGQLYGSGIKRNDQGVPILDASGQYQRADGLYHGSVLPKYTGGLQNTFLIYDNFIATFNFDYSFGGRFASLSSMWGGYSGLTAATAAMNDNGKNVRDPVSEGGGVKVEGVNAAGEAVTHYVPAQTYFQNLYGRRTTDQYIYDLDFIKLREVAIGYNLPVKKMNLFKAGIQNANISLVGRNLWLIHSKTNGDFDPSEISGVAGETAQLPNTIGWGLNLRIGF